MSFNINFFIIISIATGFLIVVEFAKRSLSIPSNITRRITHIGAALIAALSPYFLEKNLLILACLGFAVFMFGSRRISLRNVNKSVLFSSIHRVNRNTFGEVFLPLGEAVSAAIFLPQSIIAFQFGVLVMGFSDAFAGFIGDKKGNHQIKLFNGKKSIEGSFAFLLTTLVLTFIFAPYIGYHLIFIPLILTLTELVLGYGTDNFVIPMLGSYLFVYFIH